jgi:hypothetical protein
MRRKAETEDGIITMGERFLLAFVDLTGPFQLRYFVRQCALALLVALVYIVVKVQGAVAEDAALPFALREFASDYLVDILAPIALFALSNAVFSVFGFRVVRLAPSLVLCLVAALVWEYAAPLVVPWAVADPFDIIAYMVGGFLYWLLCSRVV